MKRFALPLLACAACSAEPLRVGFTGTVFDGRDDDASGVAGVDLVVRDIQSETVSSATTDDSGAFEAEVFAQTAFFVAMSHSDHVPTAFMGVAGGVEVVAAERELWLRGQDELAALREEFGPTCPEAETDGAVIEGVVRLYIPGNDPETLPLVTTATLVAWDTGGTAYTACYLADEGDDEGGSDTGDTWAADDTADPGDPQVTGNTGRFAIFGLPEGETTLELEYSASGMVFGETKLIWLPANGVAPMYPAYLPFPS